MYNDIMRKSEKVRAIVIRSRASGEKDRVIKLLCDDGRFINAVAKGAQSLKSKHRASCMLFCLSEFVLTYTGDFAYVSSSEVIKGFFTLQQDIMKMSAASYFCEAVSFCESGQNGESDILYRLLGHSLTETEKMPEEGILTLCTSFVLKLCASMGIAPHFDGCSICSQKYESYYFSQRYGGVVCGVCPEGNMSYYPVLTAMEARYMQFLTYIDLRKISSLEFTDVSTQKDLFVCADSYMNEYFNRKNNSFDMLIGLFNI
ncbi:MAG: DNA repair protein RecO [Anaerofustis stercorihominis]|nr:DNA repair protein RecO [Anaerofustis stercorihominis]